MNAFVKTPRRASGAWTTLSLSDELLEWLSADPAWKRLPAIARIGMRWQARLGSVNLRLSRATAAQHAPIPLVAPVLVLGPWRSGTTILHQLLAAATGWPTPRTWQCMNGCAFALTSRPRRLREAVRPMDTLTIATDSPQEDEFGLLSRGVDSVYRAFLMPHRLASLEPLLEQRHWLTEGRWLAELESFMRDVLRTTPGHDLKAPPHPVLLKSPNHTFRLQALLQRYPRTRFVWVLRDPTEIFLSNRSMWQQMFDLHGLTSARFGDLDRFITAALHESAAALEACLDAAWSDGPWYAVDMNDLLSQPDRVTRRILAALAPELRGQANGASLAQACSVVQAPRTRSTTAPSAPELPSFALAAIERLELVQQRARDRHRHPDSANAF